MNIFPSCYCPPIPWFAAVIRQKTLLIEQWEHYRKQRYSSRMYVKLANRVYPLTIPVERRGAKVPLKEKRISYQDAWQRQHWNSLVSAYKNSPYFEYYREPIKQCLDQSPRYLIDLHMALLDVLLKWVGWEGEVTLSNSYQPETYYNMDFRTAFDPSLQELPEWFVPTPYPQVFEGFDAGLSILDLLFNEGPAARSVLIQSIKGEDSKLNES